MTRDSWNVYFLKLAHLAASRSTCIRRQVGAVAVRDNRVLATGYNGPVSGFPHCTPETCYRTAHNIPSGEQLDRCWAVHAEQNVVAYAAKDGVSLMGATVFVTNAPCLTCSKIMLAAGVKACVYSGTYPIAYEDLSALWGNNLHYYPQA